MEKHPFRRINMELYPSYAFYVLIKYDSSMDKNKNRRDRDDCYSFDICI